MKYLIIIAIASIAGTFGITTHNRAVINSEPLPIKNNIIEQHDFIEIDGGAIPVEHLNFTTPLYISVTA